jgi:mannosyl-oligosaccharide alpha-1,2-mannosidase
MLFLAAMRGEREREQYLPIAQSLLRTGVSLYRMQPTGLGGEKARFISEGEGVFWVDDTFKLRPELIESLFYSWRITHSYQARRVAWEIFESINKYCRTDSGYTAVHDTSDRTVVYDDMQDSFFLAETLKYLYLLFSDDDVFSLDDYVFTTQAHPLRRIK